MTFNSYEFVLLFMPLFLAGFFFVRNLGQRKEKSAAFVCGFIIIGSICFFAGFGISNLVILLISICWNICTSIPMSFMRDRDVKVELSGRKAAVHNIWLGIGIIGNLILLLFFKLWGAFFPIAISFYTFNQISYIVDLSRGEIEKFDILEYLTYVLFFPKLLQGPIMGFTSFKKELDGICRKKIDWELLMRGMLLFSTGLFKKVILADTFGKAVNFGYSNLENLGSLEAILTAVFYSFQLYFDFSGYCDMASAFCMMLGFELPINFDSPYKAVNIVDFWKRWHITLTGFFTKYVYIPLGGNREGKSRTYLNYMIVFLLSGFWHGSGITFIVWGAMHGLLFVVTRAYMSQHPDNVRTKAGTVVKTMLTFIYVTAAWVFFRAQSVDEALKLFGKMISGGRKGLATGFSSCFQLDELWYVIKVTPIMKLGFAWDVCLWIFLLGCSMIIFFCPNVLSKIRTCKIGIVSTLITAVLLVWCVVSFGGVSTFLYMNF